MSFSSEGGNYKGADVCCVDVEDLGTPKSEREVAESRERLNTEQQETLTDAIKPNKIKLRVRKRVRGKEVGREQ